MSGFRVGEFQRSRVKAPLRVFCPVESVQRIEEIELPQLWEIGKRLILLDVDNTLTHWRSEEIAAEVRDWILEAKRIGFQLCILSNTRRPERLERLAKDLDVPALRGRFKPSKEMYRAALTTYKVDRTAAIMVGDQLLTDVFGANRSGIDAIWLEPLSDREFIGTKFNRYIEGHIVRRLYNALHTPVDAEPLVGEERKLPFWERTIVKQLTKFAVVGGTSFVIDAGLSMILVAVRVGDRLLTQVIGERLLELMPWLGRFQGFATPDKAGAAPLFALAALVAMLNSFIWNRRWTFETRGAHERMAQLRRFFVVAVIGYVIQLAIVQAFYGMSHESGSKVAGIAKALGAIVAAFWNFGGQRMYAFRRRHP